MPTQSPPSAARASAVTAGCGSPAGIGSRVTRSPTTWLIPLRVPTHTEPSGSGRTAVTRSLARPSRVVKTFQRPPAQRTTPLASPAAQSAPRRSTASRRKLARRSPGMSASLKERNATPSKRTSPS